MWQFEPLFHAGLTGALVFDLLRRFRPSSFLLTLTADKLFKFLSSNERGSDLVAVPGRPRIENDHWSMDAVLVDFDDSIASMIVAVDDGARLELANERFKSFDLLFGVMGVGDDFKLEV